MTVGDGHRAVPLQSLSRKRESRRGDPCGRPPDGVQGDRKGRPYADDWMTAAVKTEEPTIDHRCHCEAAGRGNPYSLRLWSKRSMSRRGDPCGRPPPDAAQGDRKGRPYAVGSSIRKKRPPLSERPWDSLVNLPNYRKLAKCLMVRHI